MPLALVGLGTLAAALVADRWERRDEEPPPGCPCRGQGSGTPEGFGAMDDGPIEIDPAFVLDRLDDIRREEVVVLDLRSMAEFRGGHIPGAVNVPSSRVLAQLMSHPELLRRARGGIVTVCDRGLRSVEAADQLLLAGYQNPVSMGGGMELWRERGYPEERGLAS